MRMLKGIRVIDFTRVVAGPYTTRILADFGAEVIKVQSRKTATGTELNTQGFFAAWNRNKKSITLDMEHPESRELVLQLVAAGDIVVENFSPRVMKNWELDYESLKNAKEDIIMLSLSAMGHTGPWKDCVAFGATVQALGGFDYLTSYESKVPVGSGFAYADMVSGLYGVFSVLAALEHRDKTGKGFHIDLSEYEAVCTMIAPELMDSYINNMEPIVRGNSPGYREAAPHGCYPCQETDRWCVIAVFDDIQWTGLCRVLENPDWTRAKRFSTLSSRKFHATELNERIGRWTSTRSAEEAVSMLQKAGIPSGVVQNAEDLAGDSHLLERSFFRKRVHPLFGEISTDTSPIRFKNAKTMELNPSPLLGQDNRYVFLDLLGLTENEYAAYVEKGIIR